MTSSLERGDFLGPAEVMDFLPSSWSNELVSELDKWEQGNLLKVTTISWLGTEGTDIVTGYPADEDWGAVNASSKSGWSIVVSQTCDIGAEGPGKKHPFVLFSPIMKLPNDNSDGSLIHIRSWMVKYLIPVPGVPEEGEWVADIRIVVPVSKSLLLGMPIIQGYPNRQDQKKFANRVASKFRRAALPEAISRDVKKVIDEALKDISSLASDLGGIEQIRLECSPDELCPTSIRIHVLSPGMLPPEIRQPLLDRESRVRALLSASGISCPGFAFDELSLISVVDYRAWVQLDVKYVSGAWF